MKKYVLGIDQSTQGTKGIIFDGSGKIIAQSLIFFNNCPQQKKTSNIAKHAVSILNLKIGRAHV